MLAALCLFFFGCKAEPFPFEELFSEAEGETVSYALVIPTENASMYRPLAETVAGEIAERVGSPTEIYLDEDSLPAGELWVTVAIGPVDLPWVTRTYRELRSQDYICRWVDGSVCMGGRTLAATDAAVSRFLTDLLPVATPTELFPLLGGFEGKGTYRAEALMLNGSPISSYRIEYERENAEVLIPMARILYEKIEEVCGAMLEIRQEDPSQTEGKRILLRQKNPYGSTHTAYVSGEGDTILLCGKESFGVSVALQAFCDTLLSEKEGDRWSGSIQGTISIPYDTPTLTMGIFSMDHTRTFSSFTEVNEMVALIREASPDMVLLHSLENGKITYLTDSMSEYRIPLPSTQGVIVKDTCPSVTEVSTYALRVGREENGFLLFVLPDEAEDWEESLAQLTESSPLPVVVALYGKRVAQEAKEETLGSLSMVCAMTQDYTHKGEEYRLSCYIGAENAFQIHSEGISVQMEYGCLTVSRQRVKL